MKLLVVLSAVLLLALADDPHGFKAVHEKCQGNPDTHIDESILQHENKHDHHEPPQNLGKHFLCMAKGLDLVTSEGRVNADGIKTHVGHVVSEADKIDEIVKACAVDQTTTDETLKHLFKCLHDKKILTQHHHAHHHGSDESGESNEHHDHEGHNH